MSDIASIPTAVVGGRVRTVSWGGDEEEWRVIDVRDAGTELVMRRKIEGVDYDRVLTVVAGEWRDEEHEEFCQIEFVEAPDEGFGDLPERAAVTLEQIAGYLREEFVQGVKAHARVEDFNPRERLILQVESATIAALWFFMMKGRTVAKSGPDEEFEAFYEALRAEVLNS